MGDWGEREGSVEVNRRRAAEQSKMGSGDSVPPGKSLLTLFIKSRGRSGGESAIQGEFSLMKL